jgi:hypothetical protein
MAAAPSMEVLLAFGDNVAAAAVAVIQADGIQEAFGPRAPVEMPKERIDVLSPGWARASPQMVQDPRGAWHYCHHRGQLILAIISQRGVPAERARHGGRVGRLRYLMSDYAQLLNAARLPYYGLLIVSPTGETFNDQEETDIDRTELSFDVELSILPSALP